MRLDQTLIDVVDEEMRLDGPHLLRPIMEQCAISLEGDEHIDQIDYEKLVEVLAIVTATGLNLTAEIHDLEHDEMLNAFIERVRTRFAQGLPAETEQ